MKFKKTRRIVSILFVLALIFTMNTGAFAERVSTEDGGSGACTQIFFGTGTTDSGAYFYGRTEDYSSSWRKITAVHPAETHAPGDMFVSSEHPSNFTWPYPEQTLRYIFCMDSYYNENNYPEPYAEIGMNEAGVVCSSSVTLSGMKSQISSSTGGADGMISGNNGLMEIDTPSIVLMQAKTAREGVELLASIIDAKGASGREGTVISDANEVWFFQVLSGHQYVGVKCPNDLIGFTPNMTCNVGPDNYVDITDTENFVCSAGLITVAQKAGTAVLDPNNPNRIKIADSYASGTSNFQAGRLRVGFGYIYGLTTQAEINARFPSPAYLDLFVPPRENKNYTLYEAMRMLACRGQGTAWSVANPSSNSTSIGNDNTQESHLIEIRPWMSPELATIEWLAQGPAEFSVFVPIFGNLVTNIHDKYYFEDHQSFRPADLYNNNTWHIFRQIYTRAKGPGTPTEATRAKYGNGVLAFWERYQKSLIEQQTDVDVYMTRILNEKGREEAERIYTDVAIAVQAEVYEYAVQMLSELIDYTAVAPSYDFEFSAMSDPDAVPVYAYLLADQLVDYAAPAASIEKLNGNKNNLTITVTEYYLSGRTSVFTETFSIDNNAAGTYQVGDYMVYVDTKGNTQIRECYIV
ncbi:MAG: C69 family dipeptidase [Oscillospiraceae bacterium]|nr:C69 family dipeptidase [Oscillospiraceae bacterium]